MASDGERRTVRGYSLWHEEREGRKVELTSKTKIELDHDSCRWLVSSPSINGRGELIESASREVRNFIGGVVAAMHRETRRAIVRPVPKPKSKPTRRKPPMAPVSCPLCNGEAWPDCELCAGEGVISQKRSVEWRAKDD